MSAPVGALASNSRAITLVNCSRVSSTEKSSAPRTFAENTILPCRFMMNGFIADPRCSGRVTLNPPGRQPHNRRAGEYGARRTGRVHVAGSDAAPGGIAGPCTAGRSNGGAALLVKHLRWSPRSLIYPDEDC